MKILGYNLEIVRGENTSIAFTIVDQDGKPFRLLSSDTFSFLDARFKVKTDPTDAKGLHPILDFILPLDSIKRFSDPTIVNIFDYFPSFNKIVWDDAQPPLNAYVNRLFYHPGVGDYRYYDFTLSKWIPYSVVITIPFAPEDTADLDYRQYFYDLTLEAGNVTSPRTVEYVKMLVPQHTFTVVYKV